ncbi:acyltransferase, partial [Escherichia coli]|nr:acyltransferase [Escherichia coli]
MLAGGLAYLYVMKGNSILSRYFHYSGILIIVASYFFVSSQDMWPGYMALMPVIGSCMYLCANYQSIISKFKPVIFIGKWSYSIYLWHWPIVVYCYVNGIDINIFTGIAMSILFGFVSYQLIEKRRVIKLLAISPVAIAASAYVMVNNG